MSQDDHSARRAVRDWLIAQAWANDGMLNTRQTVADLVAAGVYDNPYDANKGVFSSLNKAKNFKKVQPGLYRYVGLDPREESA